MIRLLWESDSDWIQFVQLYFSCHPYSESPFIQLRLLVNGANFELKTAWAWLGSFCFGYIKHTSNLELQVPETASPNHHLGKTWYSLNRVKISKSINKLRLGKRSWGWEFAGRNHTAVKSPLWVPDPRPLTPISSPQHHNMAQPPHPRNNIGQCEVKKDFPQGD